LDKLDPIKGGYWTDPAKAPVMGFW
jgi:hypothetical protein